MIDEVGASGIKPEFVIISFSEGLAVPLLGAVIAPAVIAAITRVALRAVLLPLRLSAYQLFEDAGSLEVIIEVPAFLDWRDIKILAARLLGEKSPPRIIRFLLL